MSEHKIASLLRVRYAKNRYNNLSFLQKLRPLIKSDIPYQNFKGRQRFGMKFLKAHEIKWIVNPDTLKIQTGMSLKDRAQHFMKQFPGTKMGYTLLSKVYKQHGVKRRKITWKKMANNRTEEELKREKKKLLRQLEKTRKEGYRIIYIDETMFTKAALPTTEYCLPRQNLNIDKS